MARIPETTEPSKAYVGMLIVTCVAMLVGIITLVLEGGEYDWVQKPTPVAMPPLPKEVKDDRSTATAPPKPFESVKTPESPNPLAEPAPKVDPKPAVAAVPKPVEPKPVEPGPIVIPATPAAAPAPTGPIPSPLVLPPGR